MIFILFLLGILLNKVFLKYYQWLLLQRKINAEQSAYQRSFIVKDLLNIFDGLRLKETHRFINETYI